MKDFSVFLFFRSIDMMQTLIDVLPLWQLWASLHSRPLPCCASPGCLRRWSHGESWKALLFHTTLSCSNKTSFRLQPLLPGKVGKGKTVFQRFNFPMSLFFHRPLFTGEATVDLPLTKDTTFPKSSSLPVKRALSPVVDETAPRFKTLDSTATIIFLTLSLRGPLFFLPTLHCKSRGMLCQGPTDGLYVKRK